MMIDIKRLSTFITEPAEEFEDHIHEGLEEGEASSGSKSIEPSSSTAPSAAVCPYQDDTSSKVDDELVPKVEDRIPSRVEERVHFANNLFLVVLLIAGAGGSFAAYSFARRSETRNFESQVQYLAEKIIDSTRTTVHNRLASVEQLSITVTSYAQDGNRTWPFVTLPHWFERTQSLPEDLSLCPLVTEKQRETWEEYALQHRGDWIPYDAPIAPHIYRQSTSSNVSEPIYDKFSTEGFFAPIWQNAPIVPEQVNANIFGFNHSLSAFDQLLQSEKTVLSLLVNVHDKDNDGRSESPYSHILTPVFNRVGKQNDRKVVAFFSAVIEWKDLFENHITDSDISLITEVSNSCGGRAASYLVNSTAIEYLGERKPAAAAYSVSDAVWDDGGVCSYTLDVYPSDEYYLQSFTTLPLFDAALVIMAVGVVWALFASYNLFVERRQHEVEQTAKRSNEIVSNLFPAQYRDRLLARGDEEEDDSNNDIEVATKALGQESSHAGISIDGSEVLDQEGLNMLFAKPIADLFADATVMFGDICGFTAWSSERSPDQVFVLLEQVYHSFDTLARRYNVFKVETIGDSYVAATGLPEPRKDHAELMVIMAHKCREKMNVIVKRLEIVLGPGTAELSMRFGIHSGPVTAGVLRGDKGRFQLFGDTMNTASRIESLGMPNAIHLSKKTAMLLISAGKKDWVRPRKGEVRAKGKGTIQTYWLTLGEDNSRKINPLGALTKAPHSVNGTGDWFGPEGSKHTTRKAHTERKQRLVDWSVDVLHKQIQKIIAMRTPTGKGKKKRAQDDDLRFVSQSNGTVLEEVQEIIPLSSNQSGCIQDPNQIIIGDSAKKQLRSFVTTIVDMYRDNSFHNFEHATHVTQSVIKLLSRIVKARDINFHDMKYSKRKEAEQLHQHTFGITSDPLIQFACILSALIHDVDHTGLPNAQLVEEGHSLARIYKNKSVAEQNSVDLSWCLLMEPTYKDLRACIYETQEELERFRHLVVNSVMATDIVDKELGALRKKRWAKAFALNDTVNKEGLSKKDRMDRKATIVIEHIIQASDVSHTMQHWHVYIKWNEKLFQEMRKAYKSGRAAKDPAEGWYKGELGFFDFYLIPLAKKLKECGVFSVSSDEYLNYALANRAEWEAKGQDIVKGYLMREQNAESDQRND